MLQALCCRVIHDLLTQQQQHSDNGDPKLVTGAVSWANCLKGQFLKENPVLMKTRKLEPVWISGIGLLQNGSG